MRSLIHGKNFKKQLAIALLTPILGIVAFSTPGSAQTTSVSQLHRDLQTAVCRNEWSQAIRLSGMLIGSSEISPAYREQMLQFRQQLQRWQTASSRVDNIAGCESVAAATPNPSTQNPSLSSPSRPADWERVMQSLPSSTPRPTASSPTATNPSATASASDTFGTTWIAIMDNLRNCTAYRAQQQADLGEINVMATVTITGWEGGAASPESRCRVEYLFDMTRDGGALPGAAQQAQPLVCRYSREDIAVLTRPSNYAAARSGNFSSSTSSPDSEVATRSCDLSNWSRSS